MTFPHIDFCGFVDRHKEGLTLLGLALVATMRDELPYPLNRVQAIVWLYSWVHDALKTLVNLRHPQSDQKGKV